jgi:hypothetical protein
MEGNLSEGGKEQAVLEPVPSGSQFCSIENWPLVLVLLTFSFSQGELID